MQSTLIRFTKERYAKQFLSGELYMSSLATFWDVQNGFEDQNDFCEGVVAAVPKNKLLLLTNLLSICSDYVRYRIDTYKYCNLLCFYRVDFNECNSIIQLPTERMRSFGDSVIIIKDYREFIARVLRATIDEKGTCITGDVRYHTVEDKRLYTQHSMSVISSSNPDSDCELLPFERIPPSDICKYKYGCLDKYDRYASQKEWRICYLDQELNENSKVLDVGKLSDIAEVIPAHEIAEYMIRKYKPSNIGITPKKRTWSKGTVHYQEFKEIDRWKLPINYGYSVNLSVLQSRNHGNRNTKGALQL